MEEKGGRGEGVLIPKDPKTPFNTIEELWMTQSKNLQTLLADGQQLK